MIKLNLGCGPHAMIGWINYDIDAHPNVAKLDLSQARLPHSDATIDFIFSEHFIEHITKEQCIRLLKECKRVLKPGGVLRVSTPDLRTLCATYMRHEVIKMPGTWEPESPCDMVNQGMRLWGHQHIWDARDIYDALKEAGFDKVCFPDWKQSDHPQLRGLEVRPYNGDLIFEAIRQA